MALKVKDLYLRIPSLVNISCVNLEKSLSSVSLLPNQREEYLLLLITLQGSYQDHRNNVSKFSQDFFNGFDKSQSFLALSLKSLRSHVS